MSRARNLAASVDHQLRNLAKQNSPPIIAVRLRHVWERFLYRLSPESVAVQGKSAYARVSTHEHKPLSMGLGGRATLVRCQIVVLQ